MNQGKMSSIEMLSQYVIFIRRTLETKNEITYPVLGAHGAEFFVEIASGPILSREILLTILVEFDEIHLNFEDSLKAIANKSEIFIKLPDYAHLIALLGLIEGAFNGKTSVLHPLDCSGNYCSGWGSAINSVSERLV